MENILDQLNDAQRAAVVWLDGPQLVIAGAGSGKTRVLTYKIAYLVSRGVAPWRILALTFTNKAANEMKQRIGTLVGEEHASRLKMGTFHSVFAKILRAEASHIGYTSSFTIYDENDSRSLIKNIVKEMGLDEKAYKPATVHKHISLAKNKLIGTDAYDKDISLTERDFRTGVPETSKIYSTYQQRLANSNAMDFDDLLMHTYRLFADNEEVRIKYADKLQYILVDEYQDTNYVQQRILSLLTRENHNICVVGDDYQSIYAFRGANIDNILDFQRQYPDAKLFKLERNYRSTQNIVQAANCLMRNNSRQIPKEVYSENEKGEKIIVREAYSDKEEAVMVCNDIRKQVRKNGMAYSDFAILYRANALSRSFEEELRKQNMPYRIFGGQSFFQRKEIKDIVAYFRLVANTNDEEAFRRVVNYPARGIGDTTIQKISAATLEYNVSFWQVISQPMTYNLPVNKGTMSKLGAFRDLIESFVEKKDHADAYELAKEIVLTSGIMADIAKDTSPEGDTRRENVDSFISGIHDFVAARLEEDMGSQTGLDDFLQEISLLTDMESESDEATDNRVSLMTVHAAKGLEFKTVYIVGAEETIFPSQMSMDSPRGLEEERRLMYVAITRAEKRCMITHVKSRFRYGRTEFMQPSMFLKEIDHRLVSGDTGYDAYTGSQTETRLPWETDNRPFGRNVQNSRPVADRFMADPKPRITSPRKPEPAVDPFGDGFKRMFAASGGNLRRVSEVMTKGGRTLSPQQPSASVPQPGMPLQQAGQQRLNEGDTIEHQRFGIGKVLRVEGTGENTKATVDFVNVGIKQLLLKFAKFNIVK